MRSCAFLSEGEDNLKFLVTNYGKRGICVAERRNPYHYDPEYYVHGSNVRKLNVQEQRQEHSRDERAAGKAGTRGYGRTKENVGRTAGAGAAYAQPLRREREYNQPQRKNRPEREPDRYERLREEQARRDGKKLFHISRSVSFFGILLLCGAMFCMGLLCVRYLDLQAESTRLDKTISGLRDDLVVLEDINAGKEEALVENIDLDAIYQTAVGEFGMVFPNHNDVIYYDKGDLSYVRQYADIPAAAASILDKLVP